MNIHALISFLSAGLSFFLGFFVFARNPRNRLNTMFMLLCVSVAYWCVTEFGYRRADSFADALFWLKLSELCPLVIALFVDFAIVYTGLDKIVGLWRRIVFVYGPAVVFVCIDLPTNLVTGSPMLAFWGWTYAIPQDIWYYTYAVWSLIALCLLVGLCFRYAIRVKNHTERMQALYIGAAFAVTAILNITTEVLFHIGILEFRR